MEILRRAAPCRNAPATSTLKLTAMTFAHRLAMTEAFSLGGLVLAALVLACVGAVQAALASHPLISAMESAGLVFTYTLVMGVLPATLLGAPAYATVAHLYGQVRWYVGLSIGLLPGFVALAYELHLGVWSIAAGAIVSVVTNALCTARFNNSLKSRPPTASA